MNIIVIEFGGPVDLYHTYKDTSNHVGISPRKLSKDLKAGAIWYKNFLIVIPREHKCQAKVRSGI